MRRSQRLALIELLVVIATIAMLAAILFPVFAKARRRDAQTKCLSNIKQILVALQMYSLDYNERFPVAAPLMSKAMKVELDPYIKNERIWNCPNDPNGPNALSYKTLSACALDPNYWKVWPRGPFGGAMGCQYGARKSHMPSPAEVAVVACGPSNPKMNCTPFVAEPRPVTSIPQIGEDALCCTVACWVAYLCGLKGPLPQTPWGGTSDIGSALLVHNGGLNLGFADGHAKWYRLHDTLFPKNLWTRNPDDKGWNPFGYDVGDAWSKTE